MTHERQTEYNDLTIYVDCCDSCPWLEEKITFKSCIDERYDKKEKYCSKIPQLITNVNMIPIECPLPPRYRC